MIPQNEYDQAYFEGIYTRLAKEKREVMASFFQLLFQRLTKIKKILDLGCGEGEFLKICEGHGLLSFGVDISDYVLRKARKDLEAKLFRLDLNKERLPFADNFFEAVTCFDLLEHLTSPDLVIAEAYRVLRPGGVIFVTTPNGEMWFRQFLGLIFPTDRTHVNVQKADYWQEKIIEAGFRKLEVKGCFLFGFPPGLDLRYFLRQHQLPIIIRPVFIPFLPLTSTLFIFASKEERSGEGARGMRA